MREALLSLAAVLGCSACSESGVLWVDAGEFRSFLMIVKGQDAPYAIVRATEPDDVVRIEYDPADEIALLRYRTSLETLGLEFGDFALPEKGRHVPSPADVLVWRGDRFTPADPDEDDFSALRLPWPGGDPCLPLKLERRVELPGTATNLQMSLVPLGPDRAMVVGGNGPSYELSGSLDLTPVLTGNKFPSHAAYSDLFNDEVWLAGLDGRIARGHPDRGFTLAPPRSSTVAEQQLWIDGAKNGAPTELFVATKSGRLDRFDGERWTTLANTQEVETEGVIWNGPGQAMAAGLVTDEMTHYADGRVTQHPVPLPPGNQIKSLQMVEGHGPIVGGFSGLLFSFSGGFWKERPRGPNALRVFMVLDREQGLIYGGDSGVFVQSIEEHGFCEALSEINVDFSQALWLGDRIVACGGAGPGLNNVCASFTTR